MLLLLSPSKSLDFTHQSPNFGATQPELLAESEQLIAIARGLDKVALMELMGVSENIADLNVERFAAWQQPFTEANAKAAIFAFTGDVYQGLKANDWTKADAVFAQKHLRILSGLYGVLRPLDLIQPYRLEMGIALRNKRGNNLYHFWKNTLTPILNSAVEKTENSIIVNLASGEYFKAVEGKQIKARIYTIDFKEFRNGAYKIISFNAKRARGMMANYIIKNKLVKIADLYKFNEGNYSYNEELSSEFNLVFTR